MKILSIFVVISLLSMPAFAKSCYSMKEAEAEQGVRIHSELMVISLNCQHLWPQKPASLYQKYRAFTSRNADVFAKYEDVLLQHYGSEKKLNSLRTEFANKISKDAASMRPDLFCRTYAPRIAKAGQMGERELRKWAQTFFDSHPVSKPFCAARQM